MHLPHPARGLEITSPRKEVRKQDGSLAMPQDRVGHILSNGKKVVMYYLPYLKMWLEIADYQREKRQLWEQCLIGAVYAARNPCHAEGMVTVSGAESVSGWMHQGHKRKRVRVIYISGKWLPENRLSTLFCDVY